MHSLSGPAFRAVSDAIFAAPRLLAMSSIELFGSDDAQQFALLEDVEGDVHLFMWLKDSEPLPQCHFHTHTHTHTHTTLRTCLAGVIRRVEVSCSAMLLNHFCETAVCNCPCATQHTAWYCQHPADAMRTKAGSECGQMGVNQINQKMPLIPVPGCCKKCSGADAGQLLT